MALLYNVVNSWQKSEIIFDGKILEFIYQTYKHKTNILILMIYYQLAHRRFY